MGRRIAVLLLVVAGAALVPAGSASAYRLQHHRWFAKTLTYYDATNQYGAVIQAAVTVLNSTGARVRIRSAPRGKARVRVQVRRSLRSAGEARYRVSRRTVRRATITMRPDLAARFNSPVAAQAGITAAIAHEFAHVLGLDHENRRCATMNSSLWAHCARPPEAWQHRCRILEDDDVRGLVRRLGGRARPVGPELCPAEPEPAAPAGVTATPDPLTGAVKIAWTDGAVPVTRAEVQRRQGACPEGRADPAATLLARIETAPGRPNAIDDLPPAPGVYCYAVLATGPLGRPGALATVTLNYLGFAPTAILDGVFETTRRVRFTDASSDRDGTVVAWSWNFGDGTTSTVRHPVKTFAGVGSFPVTLTVTDNTGQTNSLTRTVVVDGLVRTTLGNAH